MGYGDGAYEQAGDCDGVDGYWGQCGDGAGVGVDMKELEEESV